ncbi:MAG: hypothetical protein M0C28_17630 [Candidatus Moduliflexus flocculans]|nr:hypothetical protein [Candidatus Moduliflexus flocculans]
MSQPWACLIDISQYKDANGQPLYYADSTPTSIKATVYRSDGTLVGSTTTEVGYYSLVPNTKYTNYVWNLSPNWSGKANISTTSLAPDQYRVELEVRDDAVTNPSSNVNYAYYYDGDGTWVRTGTVFVSVGETRELPRTETTQLLSSTTGYDSLGNAVVNRDVAGNYSYKVYDNLGRVKYEVDPEQFVTEYRYDAFGNQLSLTRYATALNLVGRADPAAALSEADVAVLLAQQSPAEHAADRIITSAYDLVNRVVETRQPEIYSYDSGSATNPYFTASPTTRNEYNAFGQLTRQRTLLNTNSSADSGNWIWADVYSTYNARGQKAADVNALGYLTLYEYDALGNLTRQTEYADAWSSATNPDNRITEYVYDRLNRKVEEIKIGVEYALPSNSTATPQMVVGNLSTKYAYDKVGNLESLTDASGATIRTYYDALGRSTAVAEPPRLTVSTVGSMQAATLTVENRLVTSHSTLSRWTYRAGEKWHLVQDEAIYVNLPSTMAWGNGQVTVTVDYTLSDGTKRSSTFSPATPDALTASTSWRIDVFEWAGWQPYVASLDWVRVTKAVDGKSVLLFDQAANATSAPNVVFVGKPVIANTQLQLQYRVAGELRRLDRRAGQRLDRPWRLLRNRYRCAPCRPVRV